MKQLVFFIVLCLVLVSCSKPAEPEVAPVEKVDAKTNYTLNVSRNEVSNKPEVVPEGLKVIVLDEETDQAITNANVKLFWFGGGRSGRMTSTSSLDAINMHDGSYIICTNTTKEMTAVGGTADGYLNESVMLPKYPLTIKLKPLGPTIKVSGKIYDLNGTGLSNATLRIQAIKLNETNRGAMAALNRCICRSDHEGNYIIENLPVNLETLYINLSHQNYPRISFSNSLFNSCNGDVKLDLYMPQLMEIKGQVTTDSGKPVDQAKVWIEEHDSQNIDFKLRKRQYPYRHTNEANVTSTDSNGFFNLKLKGKAPYYAIKAATKMYQPAIAGIFTPENPPPNFVDLVIQTEGARLVGKITDQAGLPITKVHAIGASSHDFGTTINLEIEEDGSYISQTMYGGTYKITFSSSAYEPLEVKVVIKDNEISFLDVVLLEREKTKGVVLNPITREPIPEVVLSNLSIQEELKMSPKTDEKGEFWFEMKEYAKISFSHPEYVKFKKTFHTSRKKKTPYVIYMSQAAAVRVNIPDIPTDTERKYTVSINTYYYGNKFDARLMESQPLVNGTTTFTNLPVHSSPVVIFLDGEIEGRMAVSPVVDLVAGETIDVDLTLPETGKLVLNLSQPFDRKIHCFYGNARNPKLHISTASGCKIESSTLTWETIPTNEYPVHFSLNSKTIFRTNIVIRAEQTTKLFIDFDAVTNKHAKIFGVTKFDDGTPFKCYIGAYAPGSNKAESARSNTGDFVIKNLDPEIAYNLRVRLECIGKKNFTFKNILPSSEKLELSLGTAYKIYGNLVDGQGQPITGYALDGVQLGPGPFVLYPVLPGKHSVKFTAKGYVPVVKEVTIEASDKDIGEICFYDKGFTLSGIAVDADGNPIVDAEISCDGNKNETDVNGCFSIPNIPENKSIHLQIYTSHLSFHKKIDGVNQDTDIGKCILGKRYKI